MATNTQSNDKVNQVVAHHSGAPYQVSQSATNWAYEQWHDVELGDRRLNRRAIRMGIAMTRHPSQSLPQQLGDGAQLKGAYRLLNHQDVTLDKLSKKPWQQTRELAGQHGIVLFVQDTTELDYTAHEMKKGLGPIGDGRGRGLLLHTTLAVVPSQPPQVLGVGHQKAVLRHPAPKPRPKYTSSPEGLVWTDAAEQVGAPPANQMWVHVGDGGSDDFRFMHACRQRGKHFLVRLSRNRLLQWEEKPIPEEKRKIRDFARTLPAQHRYTATLPARRKRKARQAQLCLAWAPVTIPPPKEGPVELRDQPSLQAWVLRIWEVDAPAEIDEPVEWFLVTSVPTHTVQDALTRVQWYLMRWLTEDYHQCLKTGCAIEKRRLDHADDIRRLLGFLGPIAARLLQIRNLARAEPEAPAKQHIDPLAIAILAQQRGWSTTEGVTMHTFWRSVAQLGGYLGRRRDGPPGWKTLWRGWQYLQDLVHGARLYAELQTRHKTTSA
jgi:hypothetical protein